MLKYKLIASALVLVLISRASNANQHSSVKREPLLLTMTIVAPFSTEKGWKLTVDGDGSARLIIDDYPKHKTRTFQVSEKQIVQFRRIVVDQQFFALGAEYGDYVPDGNTRTLSIRQGKKSKSVNLRFLRSNASNLSEVKRALRVWNIARNWFNDADAMDMRSYDKRILDSN